MWVPEFTVRVWGLEGLEFNCAGAVSMAQPKP